MKTRVNSTKLFWTILILGLPLLAGIGRLSPDLSALVETVNRPLHLVSVDEERFIESDSLIIRPLCLDATISLEPSADSELCPIDSISDPDSTDVQCCFP